MIWALAILFAVLIIILVGSAAFFSAESHHGCLRCMMRERKEREARE